MYPSGRYQGDSASAVGRFDSVLHPTVQHDTGRCLDVCCGGLAVCHHAGCVTSSLLLYCAEDRHENAGCMLLSHVQEGDLMCKSNLHSFGCLSKSAYVRACLYVVMTLINYWKPSYLLSSYYRKKNRRIKKSAVKKRFPQFLLCMYVFLCIYLCVCLSVAILQTSSFNIGG